MNEYVVWTCSRIGEVKIFGGFSSKEAAVEWAKTTQISGEWGVVPIINFKDAT